MFDLVLLAVALGGAPAASPASPTTSQATLAASESTVTSVPSDGNATPAAAQPDQPVRPDPVTQIDDQLIVTGSLDQRPSTELPAAVTVIDRAVIDDRQATNVADLLATTPGMAVVQSGSAGKVTSVFSRGAASVQTLVLWNGVRLNDPFFGGFDWSSLGTTGVQRVEVVRGPFSALYGSDAIGGVVQVVSEIEDGVGLRIEAGNRGYRRGEAQAGYSAEHGGISVSASSRQGDGWLDNDFYDAENATLRAEWRPAPGWSLGLLGRVYDGEIGIPRDFSGAPSLQARQRTESRQIAVPIRWEGNGVRVETLLSETRGDLHFRDPEAFFDANNTDSLARRGRLVVSTNALDRWTFSAGGDWERQEVSNHNTFGVNLEDQAQETRAAFGEAVLRGERWQVEAGVRSDDNQVFGSETSFKAAGLIHISDALRVHASYGEGFRAPSVGELFFPGSGNTDLLPERSQTLEAGLLWQSGSWSLGLTGFDSDFEELIQFDLQTFTNVNLGQAKSRGVEASAGYRRAGFEVRLDTTWLDTEDRDTGARLPRRPDQASSLWLRWQPIERWSFGTTVRLVGSRDDIGEQRLPSYETVAITAAWQATQRFEPYARIQNLFDEEYEEAIGFAAPGREFVFGLGLGF